MSGRPTWRSGRSQEALLQVWEGLGGPSEGPGEVGRPTWTTGRGQESHPEVWQESGGSCLGPVYVGRPSRKSEMG